MAPQKMNELAIELRKLKDRKEALENELTETNKQIIAIEAGKLPEIMDESEISKFTVDGVGTIFLKSDVHAYVNKDDTDKFHDWLREQGNGELIRPYVFPQTLKAFAKEAIEGGQDLPDFIKVTKVQIASLRRK